jgi:EAL domain-containing protein (putative c-di-GMP-specific phosphodiesterase class I)
MLTAPPPCVYLSVNVSPDTASSAALLDLLRGSGMAPDRVVLELTEHTDVADYPAVDTALPGNGR